MNIDKNKKLLKEYSKYILPVVSFRDIVISKGAGSYIWDANGNKYLDLNSGQFCSTLGHSNKNVANEIFRVSKKIQDTDTGTLSEDVLVAAKKMNKICYGMNGRIIFLSTGAEANECCLRYVKHLKEKDGIIAFDKGYHGLSHGTAAYSMSRLRIRPTIKYSYVTRVPVNYPGQELTKKEIDVYLEEFEETVSKNINNIAGAIFEPILSGGGLIFPPKYYFKKVREICNKYNIFLIFDECQTGFGRTGTWFYYQQLECIPDFIVCAKAVGLGYPVSCVVANGNTITNKQFMLQHYSSHQNEPFGASIVSYGINTINKEHLLKQNIKNGKYLLNKLKEIADKYKIIQNVRGVGLMCGFDLYNKGLDNYKEFGDNFCQTALKYNLILQHCNNGKTIRILPNFKVTYKDIDFFYKQMNNMLNENYK